MKDFKNKVAVVTGAASGIGRALAERFAAEGMKVVLADIEEPLLELAEQELKKQGAAVLAVATDVSKLANVETLAQQTLSAFGGVHIVCNNAGVASAPVPMWQSTMRDWEWVMGVNLWSVIHGIRVFTPILLSQGTEGHIVNTASIAGLLCNPFMGIYNATKHAVVAISETLHAELAVAGAAVKVSVLCPGFVQTRIGESERNRPAELTDSAAPQAISPAAERIRAMLAAGLPPAEVAERVMEAIRAERLYILTHPEYSHLVREHGEEVAAERNPNPDSLAMFTSAPSAAK